MRSVFTPPHTARAELVEALYFRPTDDVNAFDKLGPNGLVFGRSSPISTP